MTEDATRRLRPDATTQPARRADLAETLPAPENRPTSPAKSRPDQPIAAGERIGRFLVVETLGEGGMGVVYAAYDPELDRRIAVKLLRGLAGDDSTEGRSRMQREAQALARLNHPHVITVHDVGQRPDGAMYIAMELVAGGTLADRQRDRGWREVLELYAKAASGLAAAHAAGLVHRDFKPENVLVGDDGRVRVTDFGLARLATAHEPPPPQPEAKPATSSGRALLESQLTAAGAVMGTPSYMAPEQIDGEAIDARTDQFSWCLALWEALAGEQPWPKGNLAIRSAAMKVDAPKPPASSAVPRGIWRVLVRGLQADPAARWPNLDALLEELRRATSKRTLIVFGACAAAATVLVAVFAIGRAGVGHRVENPPAPEPCVATDAPLDRVWSDGARASLAKSFAATNATFAADAAAALGRTIDGWGKRWKAIAHDSCIATRVSGTQSEALLDARTACLERRRDELANMLVALAGADRKMIERAPDLALELPDLDACTGTLAAPAEPPADKRDELARIEKDLDAVDRDVMHGMSVDAAKQREAAVQKLVDDAAKLAWPPLLARAREDLAEVQRQLGKGKQARATLMAAAAAASEGNDLDRLVHVYTELVDVEARLTSDYALGESWSELAEGTLSRLGPRDDKRLHLLRARAFVAFRAGNLDASKKTSDAALAIAARAGRKFELEVLIDLGLVETEIGDFKLAQQHYTRALELGRAEYGDKHPRVATIIHDLATVAYRDGRYADAERGFRDALALREAAFGADDLAVANSAQALGVALEAEGRLAEAGPHIQRALHILEERLGPEHPDVANALNDISAAYHQAGEFERELETNLRVLAIREKALPPDHPDIGQSLVNVAIASKALGKWDVVLPNYRRAIAIFEKSYGAQNMSTGITRLNYAEALRVRNQLDDAAREYELARTIFAVHTREDHPIFGHIWNGVGQLALARGQTEEAAADLEKAVALREKDPGDPTALAESRFALARALGKNGRGKTLAEKARDGYRSAGADKFKPQIAEIDAWLAR